MLSIIIPVYNEEKTVKEIILKVKSVSIRKEILVIDDGSTDRTYESIKDIPGIQIIRHDRRMGKGCAVRTGLDRAQGSILVIQDADLEYEPDDLISLYDYLLTSGDRVVYGSRIMGKKLGFSKSYSSFFFYWGGRFVSILTSVLWACKITDEATCYKMFRRELLDKIRLESRGFEICVEMTSKFLKEGCTIHEIPIRYNPRKMQEGKKIRWHDGLKAIGFLLKYRFL